MRRLDVLTSEYDPYYTRYLDLVEQNSTLKDGLVEGKTLFHSFFEAIPENKLDYRYGDDKWNIKEIVQHLIDTERVFTYRCFRIARMDPTPLVGFDQNVYIEPAGVNAKSRDMLIHEFNTTRDYSNSLIGSLTDEALSFVGNANGSPMSARAAGFIVVGHYNWHINIVRERYL